uniref:Uncharacterized protein n=1 Tax=Hyaloperonospora arabidopsidis (strain Emoy2) TaxID=559515 RepID=M4C272_HYAAE
MRHRVNGEILLKSSSLTRKSAYCILGRVASYPGAAQRVKLLVSVRKVECRPFKSYLSVCVCLYITRLGVPYPY